MAPAAPRSGPGHRCSSINPYDYGKSWRRCGNCWRSSCFWLIAQAPLTKVRAAMQSTYGIGGYGLLLSPSPAISVMVTEDRELVMFRGEREVARITPNDAPATSQAQW